MHAKPPASGRPHASAPRRPARRRLRPWFVVESLEDRAVVEAALEADGRVTATCRGTFVAVKEGHPAYHGW